MAATDIQLQFAQRNGRTDLLQAEKLEDTIGLCLSGGGYRAMIYHIGVLIRLNELGLMHQISEFASVSGGSLTAGMLALVWNRLSFNAEGVATNLADLFVTPLLGLARTTIDIPAILGSFLPGRTAADGIAAAYDRHLFKGANLQDITNRPRFTFMTTNLQTGSAWRFAKDYAADYRVGRIDRPNLPLSWVVAASSAFPPLLSPVRLNFGQNTVQPMPGADLHKEPFTQYAMLTDGGVYDNLGIERIWKRCRTVLVSNAGKAVPELGKPTGRWIGQTFRTLSLIQQQAEFSRLRILFGMNNLAQRRVAYWAIDTPIDAYGVKDALVLTSADVTTAARIRTRLATFTTDKIMLLLKAGYAGADASLRLNQLTDNKCLPTFDFIKSIISS